MKLYKAILAFAIVMNTSLASVGCSDNDEQAATTPELSFTYPDESASLQSIDFYAEGGSKMVQLSANVDWTVSSDVSWIALSNKSGVPTSTEQTKMYLKITAEENTSQSARTAVITLSGGGTTATLAVSQANASSEWMTAGTAVVEMGRGICIGNTLDCYSSTISDGNPSSYETAWGNPVITQSLIRQIHLAGFRAVRLPVTWRDHTDSNGNIDEAWMARVEEVVDYVLDEGMYCILNTHHDSGGDDGAWLLADNANISTISSRFANLWTQIANRFKSRNGYLIFEGYNEVLDANHSWSTTNSDNYAALNTLAQTFVDAVRTTGGNNTRRNLIVNTYSADPSEHTVEAFTVPQDDVANHLMMEVHFYKPDAFTGGTVTTWTSDLAGQLTSAAESLKAAASKKGIPLIIGECGTGSTASEAEQVKYAEALAEAFPTSDYAMFWWFDLIDRTSYQWSAVKDVLLK